MAQDFFAGESTLAVIKTPAAVSASGATPGIAVNSYAGALAFVLSTLNTAGTTPTLDVKLQTATDSNLIGTVTQSGTGNGKCTEVYGDADSVAETITVTFSSATTFSVSGSVSGALGSGTVGTRFTSTKVSFLIFAGSTAFISGDTFTIPVSARVYTDIAGATFTQATTLGGMQRIKVESDPLSCYVRGYMTIGGTVSPAYDVGLALLGLKQNIP